MTPDERGELFGQLDDIVHKLRFEDDTMDGDPEHGKTVWPPVGNMSFNDAMATLYDIEDCEITLTYYDPEGENFTGVPALVLQGTGLYGDGRYFYRTLRSVLEEEIPDEDDRDEDYDESKSLPFALLKALTEWEAKQ